MSRGSKSLSNPPPARITHYRSQLVWENGQPKAVGVPMIFDASADLRLKDLMRETLNLPYDGEDERCTGLTKGEAMIIQLVNKASDGDTACRTELLDRLMGRAQQNVRSVSLTGNLADFLDGMPDGPVAKTSSSPGFSPHTRDANSPASLYDTQPPPPPPPGPSIKPQATCPPNFEDYAGEDL